MPSPLDVTVVARAFGAIPPKKSPPFRLDLGSAAINEQFDTGDETGVIRRQKQRRLGNFIGLPMRPIGIVDTILAMAS
jgi:hypothetical protein